MLYHLKIALIILDQLTLPNVKVVCPINITKCRYIKFVIKFEVIQQAWLDEIKILKNSHRQLSDDPDY